MQRRLLLRRRKSPSRMCALLLAKREPELARRREAVGAGRAEGAAGLGAVERAEKVLPKEAVFAADFARRDPSLPFRHRGPSSTVVIRPEAVASNHVGQGRSRPAHAPLPQIPRSSSPCSKRPQTTRFRPHGRETARIFRSFPGPVPSHVLVTGASGFVGAALIPRLQRDGHSVRAFGRAAGRVRAKVPVVEGDAVTGAGLDAALDGVDCAYFLIHSMETAGVANGGDFAERDRRAAAAL